MSKELQQSLLKSGEREFQPPKALNVNTGDIEESNPSSSNQVYGQTPEDISGDTGTFSFDTGNAIWFPEDLGSESNAYYVKLEVFLLDTEGSRTKVRGDSQKEVGFDEDAKPRFVSGLKSHSGGHTRNTSILGSPTLKKLNEIIALPMPDSVVTDHSTMWSKSEGGLISSGASMADGLYSGDLSGGSSAIIKTVLMGMGSGATNLMSQVDLDGAQTHLKLLTKRAANPRNEFLFDGVNNRSFNLQWKFFPKSEKEARTLRELITKLKLYMYPELDQSTAGNFFLFPAMFDITFMRGSQENEWLYRTSTCALTNVIINYTGAGQWVSAGNSGAPVGMDLTCQFTEAEFLHRDRFKTDTNQDGVAR